MATKKVYNAGEKTPSGFTVEVKGDDEFPLSYYCPNVPEGEEIIWICNQDTETKKFISVMQHKDSLGNKDRDVKYLKDKEECFYFRGELVNAGWKKFEPPKIQFTVNGQAKELNRQQKRQLGKKVDKLLKHITDE